MTAGVAPSEGGVFERSYIKHRARASAAAARIHILSHEACAWLLSIALRARWRRLARLFRLKLSLLSPHHG